MSLPAIILVKPQMGENIGAAARVMLNFGLTDLRIIAPRDGWPNPKAEDMSAGAIEVIKNAKVYDKTADALEDITHLYATTARLRDMVKPTYNARETAEEIATLSGTSKAAIMFGAERSGLENDDVVLANAVVTIPVAPVYASLNLAQAVCVLAYECALASHNDISTTKSVDGKLVSRRELDDTLTHLEETLDKTAFFRVPEKKPRMLKNIRNMFTRNNYTEQEIRTFRGMIKAIAERLG